jgi:hypothetical protein
VALDNWGDEEVNNYGMYYVLIEAALPKPTGNTHIVTLDWFFGINNEKLKRKTGKMIQVDQ